MKVGYSVSVAAKTILLALTLHVSPALMALGGSAALADKPKVVAHRGVSGTFPEETRLAYEAALDVGADYLEFDIHMTSDGYLIAMHDDSLERTTDVAAKFPERASAGYEIRNFTLAEIMTLDAGSSFNAANPTLAQPQFVGLRVLTLDEILDIAESRGKKTPIFVEFKSPEKYPGIEAKTAARLRERSWIPPVGTGVNAEFVVFQSFDPSSVSRIKALAPEASVVLLFDAFAKGLSQPNAFMSTVFPSTTWTATFDLAAECEADLLGPRADLFGTKPLQLPAAIAKWNSFIKAAHARGLKVYPYVLDSPTQMKLFDRLGADGFFTDRADLAADALK